MALVQSGVDRGHIGLNITKVNVWGSKVGYLLGDVIMQRLEPLKVLSWSQCRWRASSSLCRCPPADWVEIAWAASSKSWRCPPADRNFAYLLMSSWMCVWPPAVDLFRMKAFLPETPRGTRTVTRSWAISSRRNGRAGRVGPASRLTIGGTGQCRRC